MLNRVISRVRLLRRGIYSGSLREKLYPAQVGSQTIQLCHSRFNPKWLTQLNMTPKTIVELGAYDGGDALRFANQFPGCRVISVEADPNRFEVVCRHLANSPVETLNVAVCESDGPIDWYPASIAGEVRGQGSIFAHTDSYREKFPFVEQHNVTQSVTGVRLDSLCSRLEISDIDLLHMDIEGAENAALHSLGSLRPKTVFLETCDDRFIGSPSVADTHSFLTELGYELIADYTNDRFYINAAEFGGGSRLRKFMSQRRRCSSAARSTASS